ncbi:hypothetical protein [Hyphomicrobium sp.]|uniref:hypothetical protein n=1 Tax=Hyphomicrobium sp. TaxID=82 RepID=UPI000FA5640A|nr:hypothetical protein [Hyphomicrobium sp.]RUP00519.1 MAG: hypothetical protein EKK30_00180 [Hyphomicrobium sp.]
MADVDCTAAQRGPFDFIGDIYDSALDPSRWSDVLYKTSKLVQGCAAALIVYSPSEDNLRVAGRWNINSQFEKAMTAAAPLNPAVPAIWLLGIERPIITSAFLHIGQRDHSIWRQKIMQPHGLLDTAIVPLARTARAFSAVMIMRPHRAGTFDHADTALLAELTPYFREAASVAALLDYNPSTMQSTSTAMILTNAQGRILHANAAGQCALDGCALLCLDEELAARERASDMRLRTAIARAACLPDSAPGPRVASLAIKGIDTSALAVRVMPISKDVSRSVAGSDLARVAVFANSARRMERPAHEMNSGHRAVAVEDERLLALLVQGLNFERAAWTLSMSQPAADASLARLLARMKAHNATELVARIKGPPSFA